MRQNYLAGKAKRQHSDTPILDTTLEEDESNAATSSSGASMTGVCSRCLPVVQRYLSGTKSAWIKALKM